MQAQTPEDIFNYSQRSISGTARSLALGGAQTSLGAEFGSLTYNPAGVALYRSSELTVSPGVESVNNDASYLSNSEETIDTGFSFGGIGLVFTAKPNKRQQKKGWQFKNFAVGMNRVYTYNREIVSEAFNPESSITDFFAEDAEGFSEPELFDANLNNFGALAYRAFLIDPTNTEGFYTSILDNGQIDQRERVASSGRKNEILLSYGGNFKDRFYFGGALGIVSLQNEQSTTLTETDNQGLYPNFETLRLSESINVTGSGVNVSLGAIMRLSDELRIGASIKSPTRYNLTETFNSNVSAITLGGNGIETMEEFSPDGFFEYDAVEPYRFTGGLSYFFKKRGFIAIDYELVDYSTMRARFAEDAFDDAENALNQAIIERFQASHTLKIGAEVNLKRGFAARGGYNITTSPYVDESLKSTLIRFALGLGYRTEKYFVDVAYSLSNADFVRQPYSLANRELAQVDVTQKETNILITLGTRF